MVGDRGKNKKDTLFYILALRISNDNNGMSGILWMVLEFNQEEKYDTLQNDHGRSKGSGLRFWNWTFCSCDGEVAATNLMNLREL